jgi:hypothetical protein
VDNWKVFSGDYKSYVPHSEGHADELVIRIADMMLSLPAAPAVNQLQLKWLTEALATSLIEGRVRAFVHIWSLMPDDLKAQCLALPPESFVHPSLVSGYHGLKKGMPQIAENLRRAYSELGPIAKQAAPFFKVLWKSLGKLAYVAALKHFGLA